MKQIVLIAGLRLGSEATALFIPRECYEELLSELVPPSQLDALLRELKVIGSIEGFTPSYSGVAYLGTGPYRRDCVFIEFVKGLYLPLKGIVPNQCVYSGDEFIGCRYGLQKIVLDSACRKCEADGVSEEEVLRVSDRVFKLLKDARRGVYAWILHNDLVTFWDASIKHA